MKYICQYCGKECKTAQSLSFHQNRCRMNPNAKHNKAWNSDIWTQERILKYNKDKFDNKFMFCFDKNEYGHLDKITFKCPIDGVRTQTIIQFLNSPKGCIKCSKRNAGKNKSKEELDKWRYSRLSNLETWKEKCTKIHNGKYDYSLCEKYVNSRSKMKIICPIHGEFIQPAYKHLNGNGCKLCGNIIKTENWRKTTKENYIKHLIESYPQFDFSIFDYEEKQKTGKIRCICPKHGEILLTRSRKCSLCEQEKKDNLNISSLINSIEIL